MERNIDDTFTICICECVLNVINGNVIVNTKQRNALAKHMTALRKLIDPKVPIERKQKIIKKACFICKVIGPVLSIINGVISNKE